MVKLYEKTNFETSETYAMGTFTEMRDWIKEKLQEHSKQDVYKIYPGSMGIAAFGPMCLDKTSKSYGNITTTPKIAW